ncbi:hypothetical protein BCR34DRAFT_29501 [Clohesyomyces aquaticus]|uniref:Uncharacterized protein n=1 Tax=Clohesyomyces aquaticus TaxID=1231657 RepID=A0A1Y1Z9Q7_9PLEO|nr:hypothetical protein BCR34DRAFT_29501 [Clohesyomyces aquaticus]
MTFLSLPSSIRNQIYQELLVHPVLPDDGSLVKEHLTTSILYTNKQIYAESSYIFYSRNLFTVVLVQSPSEETPRLPSESCPAITNLATIARCRRFAMKVDIYGMERLYGGFTAAFVLLPHEISQFIHQCNHKLDMEPALVREPLIIRFRVLDTFRYTVPRASELLFAPILNAEPPIKFKALEIVGPIAEECKISLHRGCVHPYEDPNAFHSLYWNYRYFFCREIFEMMFKFTQPRTNGSCSWMVAPPYWFLKHSEDWLKSLDIFRSCHQYRVRHCHKRAIDPNALFGLVSDIYCLQCQYFLIAAKSCHASFFHREARRAVEAGITYLNNETWISETTPIGFGSPEEFRGEIEKAKVALSLTAANTCLELGDIDSARAYIRDAYCRSPKLRSPDYQWIFGAPVHYWIEGTSPEETSAILWTTPSLQLEPLLRQSNSLSLAE